MTNQIQNEMKNTNTTSRIELLLAGSACAVFALPFVAVDGVGQVTAAVGAANLVAVIVAGLYGAIIWNGYAGGSVVVTGFAVLASSVPVTAHGSATAATPILAAALVVGTVGHAAGALLRRHRDGETWSAVPGWWLEAFFGRDPSRAMYWFVLTGVLCIVGALLMYATPPASRPPTTGVDLIEVFYPPFVLGDSAVAGWGVIIGWAVLAIPAGYRGDGILAGASLVFGPLFGANLVYFATVGPSVRPILFAVSLAAGLAAVFGTAGFLLGWLIRQYWHRPDEHRHEAV
jgi:hypothetical protein